MIGYLEGEVLSKTEAGLILKTTTGIGYQVSYIGECAIGSFLALYISHIIREDQQTLYGFIHPNEKKFFQLLLKVKGVGPKSAFTLLTFLGRERLIRAIRDEDKKTIQSAPGIGSKGAAQIILDLSDKIMKLQFENSILIHETEKITLSGPNQILDDALEAFKSLGFPTAKVLSLAEKTYLANQEISSEQLVQKVLQQL